jgi:hypothetical protein
LADECAFPRTRKMWKLPAFTVGACVITRPGRVQPACRAEAWLWSALPPRGTAFPPRACSRLTLRRAESAPARSALGMHRQRAGQDQSGSKLPHSRAPAAPFVGVAELSHGLPGGASGADWRFSQVCGFSGFTVRNAADFDPSPACGPPSAEAAARRPKAQRRRAGGGPKRSRRQAAGRKAQSLRYRLSTLVWRRDFLSLT